MLNPFGTCDGLYQRAFKGVILCLPTRHKVGGSGKALRNVGRTERKLETVHFRVLDIPFYPLLYKLHFTMAEYRPSIVIGLALAPLDGEAWCIATHEGPEQGQKKESWIGCAEAPEKVATCEVALRSGRVDHYSCTFLGGGERRTSEQAAVEELVQKRLKRGGSLL